MAKLTRILAWLTVALTAALVALNWPLLAAAAPIDLFFGSVQLPWGLFLLGIAAPLLLLFTVDIGLQRWRALSESRELMAEVRKAQNLADKAEESRMENLHRLIATEFRLVHSRLESLAGVGAAAEAPAEELPLYKLGP